MCGRYTLTVSRKTVADQFGTGDDSNIDVTLRFNIAPGQDNPVVRPTAEASRSLDLLRWGFLPSWAKPDKFKAPLINARAETLSEKPTFRAAFKYRRCIVPATGWYEWLAAGKTKTPHYLHAPEQPLMAFAGLWEEWITPDGEIIPGYTIITTEAAEPIRHIHDRMPLILPPETWDAWLTPKPLAAPEFADILAVEPPQIAFHPVGTLVNSPRNDRPECVQPLNT